MSVTFHDGRVTLHCGDSLNILDLLSENCIDSCVCDPPYHLHSIVKRFAKTGRTESTSTSSGPHQRTATGARKLAVADPHESMPLFGGFA